MVKVRAKGFDEVEFEGVPLEEYERLKEKNEALVEVVEGVLRYLYGLHDDLGELIEEVEDMLRGEDK